MLSIFQRARRVVVWLGTPGENTKVVWDSLESSHQDGIAERAAQRQQCVHGIENPPRKRAADIDQVNDDWGGISRSYNSDNIQYDAKIVAEHVYRYMFKIESYAFCDGHRLAFLSGLHDLLTREWYERLWILQEVWAAAEITINCGMYEIAWSVLRGVTERTFKFLKSLEPGFHAPFARVQHSSDLLRRIDGLAVSEDNLARNDLLLTFQRAAGSRCSNSRDRIYGVLGMTDVKHGYSSPANKTDPYLQIDYTLSVRDVYTDVLHYLLKRDRSYDRLEYMIKAKPLRNGDQIMGGTVEGEDLPSWCPNWSVPFTLGSAYAPENFQGGASIPQRLEFYDSTTLLLHGNRIGKASDFRYSYPLRPSYVDVGDSEIKYTITLEDVIPEHYGVRRYRHHYFGVRTTSGVQVDDLVVANDVFQSAVVLRESHNPGFFTLVDLLPLIAEDSIFKPPYRIVPLLVDVDSLEIFKVR